MSTNDSGTAAADTADTAATRTPTARLPLRDLLSRERYLMRFSMPMQDYPARRYRAIKHELRAELTAAGHEVGMRRALTDLGHPRVLAEHYIAELGNRRPRYGTGIASASVTVAVLAYLFLAYAVGALDTLEAMGGGTVTRYPFGSETVFSVTGDAMSLTSSGSWGWLALYAGAALVAFVLGSRLWRLRG